VHLLDRVPSCLMVCATISDGKHAFQKGSDRAIKGYVAVVEGNLPKAEGTMESHLNETNPFRGYSAPASPETRLAVTHFRVLARGQKRTLVELILGTGRRHQIRVHLADLGCPIVGDEKYGSKTNPAHRLGLHACGLKFLHPVTQQELSFESPLPKELARLV